MSDGLTITQMRVSNFMGLRFIEVSLGPGLTQVTGRNGQGKTSFIKAIKAVLGGEKHCPEEAVHRGARRASVDVSIGRYRAIRRWNDEGRSTLILEDAEGNQIKRPQEQLKALIGELTFDPEAFRTLAPKQQAEILRKLTGLSFDDLETNRKGLYDERTQVNRAIDREAASATSFASYPEAPAEPVNLTEILARLNIANETLKANETKRRDAKDAAKSTRAANDAKRVEAIEAKKAYLALEKETNGIDEEIMDLIRKTQEARTRREGITARMAVAAGVGQRLQHEAEALVDPSDDQAIEALALVDPDVKGIQKELYSVEETNRQVRANADRRAAQERLDGLKDEAQRLTDQIEDIDAQKFARLKAAESKMPVEGLSISGDVVLFKGLPLEQASSAEGLELCWNISAALNPKLDTILIDEGERLDHASLERLATWANDRQMQVILARVSEDKEGIVIENGEVAAASPVVDLYGEEG